MATNLVSSKTLGATRNWTEFDGMKVTIGGSDIYVTALGRAYRTGNTGITRKIGIYFGGSGNANINRVGGGSISIIAGSDGVYQYLSLANPLTLRAGIAYQMMTQFTADNGWDFDSVLTVTGAATVNNAWIGPNTNNNWGSTGNCYGPLDLQYETTDPTVAYTHDIYSYSVGSAGNPFSNWAGRRIYTGPNTPTITGLGRIMISGNSQTHTLKIVDNSNADVSGASCSVNMTGGTPGGYVFANFASPITLSANTYYHIFSEEFGGGDQMYNDSGTYEIQSQVAYSAGSVWKQTGGAINQNSNENKTYSGIAMQVSSSSSGLLIPRGMNRGMYDLCGGING